MKYPNQKIIQQYLILIALCFSYCFIANAFCQTPIHYIYNSENGLPSSEAYSCIQDSEGNIWIATDNGVSKFNSREFKNYTVKDGLPGPVIFKMFLDRNNRLWMTGHNRSICYYDSVHDRFVEFTYNNVLAKEPKFQFINRLKFHTNDDGIDIETSNGLFEITNDGEIIDKSVSDEEYVFQIDSAISQSYRNKLNTGSVHLKVYDLIDTTLFIATPKQKIQAGVVNSYQISDSEYYFIFKNVIIQLKDNKLRIKYFSNIILDFGIWKDQLYIATYSEGLFALEKSSLQVNTQFFKGHTISAILVDRENSLWVTSTELGLIHLPYSYFESFLTEEKAKNIVNSFQFNNRIFFVTKSQQLYEFDVNSKRYRHISENSKPSLFNSRIALHDGHVHTRAQTSDGNKLAYNISENSFVKKPYPLGQIKISDSLFLVGGNSGLFTKNYPSNSFRDSIITGRYVSDVFEYDTMKFMISLKPGLIQLDANDLNNFKLKSIKKDIDPTSITKYKRSLIITTKTSGVWRYENNHIQLLSSLLPKIRYSGCAINNDLLLFSSSNGLYTYNIKTGEVDHYGRYHGLQEVDLLNVFTGTDGNIWLLSRSGLVKLNKKTSIPSFKPTISLSYVIVDADTITNNSIKFDHRVIEFQVGSVCYKCLGDVTYKYRLIGFSDEWLSGHQPEIRFNSLPAGNYSFEVIAITPEGEESNVSRYSFTIPPPFWNTWWFYFILSLAFITSILIIHYFRKNARRKKLILIEKLNYNRQLALRKYLNPHFIFNALNSIQSYMISGNKHGAQTFIAQFSKLMREYLDAGVNEEISVKKELEILDRYVDLEEIRLQKSINLIYSISKDFDLENTIIPSFILQPIIENSIWHGFTKCDKGGTVSMAFKIIEKTLHITIIDDGSGLSKNQKDSTNSNSTNINRKRLELLSKLHNEKFAIITKNNVSQSGEIIGCKVHITLPFHGREQSNSDQ